MKEFHQKEFIPTVLRVPPYIKPSELRSYRESQKDLWDLNSVIETAEKKGKREGRAEGLAEGEAIGLEKGREEGENSALIKVAEKMKNRGDSIDEIIRMTGLTEEVIAGL